MNAAISEDVKADCLLRPGNTNCGGCGMSTGLTLLGRALENEDYSLVIPACCGIVTAGAFPTTAYSVPVTAATFASSPAFASGVAAVNDLNPDGKPKHVICWAGDGGTYDIGIATLSAAAERNENLIYICYDNEIYGNTGGQRSSATPFAAKTTTTPGGKIESKKDIIGIMAAHRVPYAATLSIAHPEDFRAKIEKALKIEGFRFFLIHAPCPTGWKTEPAESIELVSLAVRSGMFPLYEVFDGTDYRLNAEPDGTDPEKYYTKQRRFSGQPIDLDSVRVAVGARMDRLRRLAGLGRH
ncbi:MAG: pyruvate synthase subunit beta [Xanthomonadales bacterium]|nr:pyruvate synthase subunit beta [Gammaproteobacteria bacterium]MBT8053200.1 pyruvate synthase subunit beta [Gammaproteobacteria bacterium]NND58349.1 pyruvate synthase subunit beta [Xanthomonadales bacterium]NNK50239.1 pyruvate synthase subunit beta [Xanthomonadales bacterium]